MTQADSNRFYDGVPVFDRFADIADPSRYQPLPDDWLLGLADVVQSTMPVYRLHAALKSALSYTILRFKIRVGSFVPATYLKQVVENSDFRKYDDALRMVIDCTPQFARSLENRLAAAAAAGIARYGIHQQDRAMMTCFTPSAFRSDHVHFVDGALGGYALAARALKGAA